MSHVKFQPKVRPIHYPFTSAVAVAVAIAVAVVVVVAVAVAVAAKRKASEEYRVSSTSCMSCILTPPLRPINFLAQMPQDPFLRLLHGFRFSVSAGGHCKYGVLRAGVPK